MSNVRRGFTLIELLLASSLAIIVSIVSASGFVAFNNSQTVNGAAYDIAAELQKAKSRAQSQVKPSTVPSCSTSPLSGYIVRICSVVGAGCNGAGATRYELHVICGATSTLIESRQLPKNVSFGSGTSATFKFQVLNGAAQSGTVIISGYSRTKTLQVSGIGNIVVQ